MFFLPFGIPESPQKIKLKDPIFSIGSCFSDNIGNKLRDFKFDIISNPLGVIYNPYSIFKNIRLILSEGLDPDNFTQIGDIFYHWDAHSAISGTTMNSFQRILGKKSREFQQSMISSEWMIITLGTIYIYRNLKNDKIVANCHKAPRKEFEKLTLSTSEIIEDYQETMEVVRSVNPGMKVILTVSAVRHIRDGLIENNISKATLIKAVNKIISQDRDAFYFPSYELMIDVLRDYRFYREDMIHPNDQAITYIWERFIEAFMDEDATRFIEQWGQIRKSLAHRPFHPASNEHQNFLKSTISQLKTLEGKVDTSTELMELEKQVKKNEAH